MSIIQSVRGMNDLQGADALSFHTIIHTASAIFEQAGFGAVVLPVVEQTELFKRAVGDVTDIVEKEMYTFVDRSDVSLSLRPEGTAGCARALIENGWWQPGHQFKAYYYGPMFRYERPQKGRYRQFHQFGVEHFGTTSPFADAQIISCCTQMWETLGIDGLRLELNSIGKSAERLAYKKALVAYLQQHVDALDADSQRRLESNPLRILDSKVQATQVVLQQAPKLQDSLSAESMAAFDTITRTLDKLGIVWEHNPYLVRGLDYYNDCVFEWVSDDIGTQSTVCGGGRYDGLVEQLSGKPVPGVGFAMGIERIMLLTKQQADQSPRIFVVCQQSTVDHAFVCAERLRRESAYKVVGAFDGSSMKSQFKKADKWGAQCAVIVGEDEVSNQSVTVKWLESAEQVTVKESSLHSYLGNKLGSA